MKRALLIAVLILVSIITTATVSAQTMNYDPILQGLALNRLSGAKNLVIWPNDPELARTMAIRPEGDKIYMTFHYPVRNRPLNGIDLRSYQTAALASLAELLEAAFRDYHISASFEVYDENNPGDKTVVSKNVTIRTTDKVMKNVRREGEFLYSGDLSDGSRGYSGSLLLSFSKDDFTKAVSESETANNEVTYNSDKNDKNTMDEMQRKLNLINSILEKILDQSETKEIDRQILGN